MAEASLSHVLSIQGLELTLTDHRTSRVRHVLIHDYVVVVFLGRLRSKDIYCGPLLLRVGPSPLLGIAGSFNRDPIAKDETDACANEDEVLDGVNSHLMQEYSVEPILEQAFTVADFSWRRLTRQALAQIFVEGP